MGKNRFLRGMCYALAALIMLTCAAYGEDSDIIPVSPEPPLPDRNLRPTAAPTAEPNDVITDHINHPEENPGFRFSSGEKLLDIWFPSIRDADEAILMYDGEVWLIDCGDERAANRSLPLLKKLGITKIDRLINTHPHHDHINGLAITDDQAKVAEVWLCFPPESTSSGLKLLEVLDARGIPLRMYGNGDTASMGDGAVRLEFWQARDEQLDMNDTSAQIMVRYGSRSAFFMADMEFRGQEVLLKQMDPQKLSCDIFKYPHHGKSAMHEEFYNALNARLTVVTSYFGRNDQGQKFINNKHLPAAFTAKEGMCVHLQTDGKFWLCEYVPVK